MHTIQPALALILFIALARGEVAAIPDMYSSDRRGGRKFDPKLSPERLEEMLTVFNQARRQVNPRASDMVELTWDNCLETATLAYCQKVADAGGWDYTDGPNYTSCGGNNNQNLFRDISQDPVPDARYRSIDIGRIYSAKTGTCSGKAGACNSVHIYLNIVASNTVRVACSAVICPFSPKKVCECCGMYTDPNIPPVKDPFASWTPGSSCSKCPSGYNKFCDNGLCSNQCRTKYCHPIP